MFPDNSFDAVLSFGGPVSHIKSEKEREKAVSELIRVAKPNAPVFISVFGKYGKLMRAPRYWHEKISQNEYFMEIANKGENYFWKEKYYAHYFTIEEIKELLSKHSLEIKEIVGLEGLATPYTEEINKLYEDKKAWKNWMKMHLKVCRDSVIAGISVHILAVGVKKKNS